MRSVLFALPIVGEVVLDSPAQTVLARDLPRLWNAPESPVELKKQILRAVILPRSKCRQLKNSSQSETAP